MRAGGRREGARERAVVHSAAATVAALAAVVAPTHHTPSHPPLLAGQRIIPAIDAMRMNLRYHASRGDRCASDALLGSFGRQLLTDYREARYITRMCPFGPRSRHMQHIPCQYWKIVVLFTP
jgi:hypothetical protein